MAQDPRPRRPAPSSMEHTQRRATQFAWTSTDCTLKDGAEDHMNRVARKDIDVWMFQDTIMNEFE